VSDKPASGQGAAGARELASWRAWPSRGAAGHRRGEHGATARVVVTGGPLPPTNRVGWVAGRESESRFRACGIYGLFCSLFWREA
jgi:hypothetical protein